MLFQQLHIGDGHAAVHGFAHVVNGQQGELDGGQGFHFDTGLTDGFHCGATENAVGFFVGIELDGDARQGEWVAQRNQVAGFFGRHDAGDAGNAKHIAFFGGALQNDGQCGRVHDDPALRHGNPVGGGFGSHIDHVGLALGVKMCQCRSACHVVFQKRDRHHHKSEALRFVHLSREERGYHDGLASSPSTLHHP
jgi:hypothetical protein